MIGEMIQLLTDRWGFFQNLLVQHLTLSFLAILIAVIFGGLTGILISEFQQAAKPTLGIINFLYTIPSISMLGFLIPFSGVGDVTAVIALTVYALLPMVRNTHTGMSNVDPAILEAARGMGSTRLQILQKIKIPLALPVVMSGIRSMVTMTIALAGIASFIGAGGLGVAIYRGITTNNAAMTMAGSLLIALLALVVDFFLGIIEKHIGRRKKTKGKWMPVFLVLLALTPILWSIIGKSTAKTLHIATKPMTEQYILGEMLALVIEEETAFDVDITQGVGGGTSNIAPAMAEGDFDLYPEYTGTGWNMVLKEEGIYSEDRFEDLQKRYNDELDMSWEGMFGFNNTFGTAVRKDIAEKYDLQNVSDLRDIADELVFGAEYDFFERKDGFEGFAETYDLSFKETMDMDIGLKYQAMEEKEIDVMVIFTTDGQLEDADVVVLEDDKHFYPSYLCGIVIRNEVLEKNPKIWEILDRFTGLISDEEMARMNHAVEIAGKEPKAVAKTFLQEKGVLK